MTDLIHAEIKVTGQVQGVGFRPFIYRLAQQLNLPGWVRNTGAGVEICVEGTSSQIDQLLDRMHKEAPALAKIESTSKEISYKIIGLNDFSISPSQAGKAHTGIVPDMAICAECLIELFNPNDRRYRHAFINCIYCGPRFTLTARLPYDRANTSMAQFTQCPDCQAEYDTPSTRRFHAQPNACPKCGPQLKLLDADWKPIPTDDSVATTSPFHRVHSMHHGAQSAPYGEVRLTHDPITLTAKKIKTGQIVAIKGVGGFHLVCDANNAEAVTRLRRRKHRDEKPFAVMLLNASSAAHYCELSAAEIALLETAERPIVLLNKLPTCDAQLPGIAPGLSSLGVLLPYTPLHYLLFHELLGKPAGIDWLREATSLALVMTSANPGGEPLVKDDAEARTSLANFADAFLTHDREILHRCDDSVMKWQGSAPAFIRRARGYTPRRILLPFSGPSILACGAWLKNTICLTRGNEAFVSQHIGDLDQAATRLMLEETVHYLSDILDVQVEAVAHDLHPDFFSSQFAQNYAQQNNLPCIPVQHHHAHIAAICAEHCHTGALLGLALDGVGFGSDGSAWGGELLHIEGTTCQRLGHLATLPMPGSDRAAREPWRMAAAVLFGLQRGAEIATRFPAQTAAASLNDILQRGLNCPPTSSMGRLFDAAAGLLGVSQIQAYEGQAAMLLEGLAQQYGAVPHATPGYNFTHETLDFSPLLSTLADCPNTGYGAALLHATLAQGLSEWVLRAAAQSKISHIALGGGCFLNSILHNSLTQKLQAGGLSVLNARQLPPNDAAISLGQAMVAMQIVGQK
ncbi:MAG: carbamoyltransferase HypF [Gallionellaceae bacterium]|jgi:hydrogenase maturation protein HypF